MIDERHLGVCRASFYVDGALVIQPDGIGGAGGLSGFGEETIQNGCQGGFLYRPLDPKMDGEDVDPAGACSLDVVWEGGVAYCRPLHDPRVAALCPEIEKGEALMAGGSEDLVSTIRIFRSGIIEIGTDGAGVACVRAPEFLQWVEALEGLLTTMGGATMPPTTAAVSAWKSATLALKEALKATKVKVT